MKLIAVRHGETYGNVNRVTESRTHGRMTEHGMKQVAATAKMLKDEFVDVIYTSNLQRCMDTAFMLAEHHVSAAVNPVHSLRERDKGEYEGKPYQDVPNDQYEGAFVHVPTPGGESWRDVERRVGLFLNQLYAAHPQATVMLITHAGPIKVMRSLLDGISLQESIGLYVPQASVHYFTMDRPTRMGPEEGAL